MWDPHRRSTFKRDIEEAITALKKGAQLLKYGRRGKPKICPFRLSADESTLIWFVGKDEKQLILNQVSKIIPGQRTAIFQRYPQPDKEYQSFSLIYKDRSLDLICKDKDEAEVWFVGLKALVLGQHRKRLELERDRTPGSVIPNIQSWGDICQDSDDVRDLHIPCENTPENGFGQVLSNVTLYTAPRSSIGTDSTNSRSSLSSGGVDNSNERSSASEIVRVSASSAVSSSSYGSCLEDFDALCDVFVWGDNGFPGHGLHMGGPFAAGSEAALPKALQIASMLDVQHVACGSGYTMLVTKQGKVYSWGEGSGGRLGHGTEVNVSNPKLIDALADTNVRLVACGEYHSCAVTFSGNLYTWGDGSHNSGLLGHGSEASHWIPKLVVGPLEGLTVSSVSCGPWHTAIITSAGQLFTFGGGIFGALGHGDHENTNMPREVEALRGSHIVSISCGVWHTAAVVEIRIEITDCSNSLPGKLFTWGNGDKGQLGHGDKTPRFLPTYVTSLAEQNFCQVVCGQDITIALTTSGRVYTMGSADPNIKLPACVAGKIHDSFVTEISCGAYHVAVLTSRAEVYTWGKGANGQLGHGDNDDLNEPTLVEALKGKQVKKIVCGPNFTAAICTHKWVSGDDLSICSGCLLPFCFKRKQYNCYNCGLVFCNSCTSRKSVKAALAPNVNRPYRVCEECYTKIQKTMCSGGHSQIPKHPNGSQIHMSGELAEKDTPRSRLSLRRSFKGESKRWQIWKSESSSNQLSPILNERTRWGIIRKILCHSSNSSYSGCLPVSIIASRSSSPISSLQSPSYSRTTSMRVIPPKEVAGYPKRTDDGSSQEIVSLHSQVTELTRKLRILESDLENTSKQLNKAMAIAGEETAKCKASKEVIISLTAKLKDVTVEVTKGYAVNADGSLSEELVQQDEPGVFITVSPLNPGGEMFFKRVHLSQRWFNREQAEKWWADNQSRLQQKYNFQGTQIQTTLS